MEHVKRFGKSFIKTSRRAERTRIYIGRCANGAASLRAAVPCLNMDGWMDT